MSVSFDWNFQDESKSARGSGGGGPHAHRRRSLFRGVVVFCTLVLVALLVRAGIARQLKAVEKDKAELRAVIELELKTIARGDQELFRSFQDPIDPTWQERQIERYIAAEMDRFVPAPGLVPSERSPEIERIHFSGRNARVEMTHWFEVARLMDESGDQPSQVSQPFPFYVTWFYRQDDQGNWYHTEPPGDYWGIPYSWHGTRLEVRATEIEAERIDATARELAVLVSQACLWIGCREDEVYTLSFEDISLPEVRGQLWALPALYLAGMPGNAEAWDAWERALKVWVIEMLARTQVGEDELTERAIFQQLVARLQERLGLTEGLADRLTSRQVDLLTTAIAEREQHSLLSLWQAKADPDGPGQAQLLTAEIVALLEFIEGEVGIQQLFELLPALREYARLSDVLEEIYGLDQVTFSRDWLDHLSDLTGVVIVPEVSVSGLPLPRRPLAPPPLGPLPSEPPGDQIAVNCGGRIWVGNADGSDLVPLTAQGQSFDNLIWSPDGHWLLTMWQPTRSQRLGALYLLAADGSEGRLLTDEPAVQVRALGWSPGGREAIYFYQGYEPTGNAVAPEVRAIDVETGETRQLPGMPVWSPDGEKLVYVTVTAGGPDGSAWLADANWENARPIATRVWLWPRQVWSPDSSKLALTLPNSVLSTDGSGASALTIYDLETDRYSSLISATDLEAAVLSFNDSYVTDGSDRAALADRPLTWLSVLGWSADGRHLLAWAQGPSSSPYAPGVMVLMAIPLDAFAETSLGRDDCSAEQLLAFGEGQPIGASWSPAHPDQLTFSWLSQAPQVSGARAYLLDLNAGSVFTAPESLDGQWSPDGEWVAFVGARGSTTITDQEGQACFEFRLGNELCHQVAWNPAADLSGLREVSRPILSQEHPQ
jgi:hypothetical protein